MVTNFLFVWIFLFVLCIHCGYEGWVGGGGVGLLRGVVVGNMKFLDFLDLS